MIPGNLTSHERIPVQCFSTMFQHNVSVQCSRHTPSTTVRRALALSRYAALYTAAAAENRAIMLQQQLVVRVAARCVIVAGCSNLLCGGLSDEFTSEWNCHDLLPRGALSEGSHKPCGDKCAFSVHLTTQ